uniref:Macroglobulin domain-containing protein n=1 Tax=Panagrolaimus sp. PS1159 TaxID=55785 RepID=A0AC35FYE6_9BILA
MRLIACLFLFLVHFVSSLRQPFVVLPTAVKWQSENSITVIPRDWSKIPLNIEIFITAKESTLSLSEQLFYETRKISDIGSAQMFTFNSSHQPNAYEYGIKVSVTGHKDYYTVLYGVSNLKTISIQTDKGYYRPGENINVRILPINGENQLYKSDLKISLVNPQGFNVITNTLNIPEKQNRFLQAKFEIPEFAPHGFWSISVKPTNSSLPWMFSNVRIRVQDYSLPKFFITMAITEMETENKVKISILAQYFHGQPVRGSVYVVCGTQTQLLAGNVSFISFIRIDMFQKQHF